MGRTPVGYAITGIKFILGSALGGLVGALVGLAVTAILAGGLYAVGMVGADAFSIDAISSGGISELAFGGIFLAILGLALVYLLITVVAQGRAVQWLWGWDGGQNGFFTGVKVSIVTAISSIVGVVVRMVGGVALGQQPITGADTVTGTMSIILIGVVVVNVLVTGWLATRLWGWE